MTASKLHKLSLDGVPNGHQSSTPFPRTPLQEGRSEDRCTGDDFGYKRCVQKSSDRPSFVASNQNPRDPHKSFSKGTTGPLHSCQSPGQRVCGSIGNRASGNTLKSNGGGSLGLLCGGGLCDDRDLEQGLRFSDAFL